MNRAYNEFYILLFQELKDEFGLTGQQESMLFHINLNENTTANHIATTFNISKVPLVKFYLNWRNRR